MLIGQKPIGTIAYMGGIPSVYEEFCFSLAQLLIFSREVLCTPTQYIHFDRVKFSDHGPARNSLVDRFLGDWLLMLDTDHEPPPDLLHRMLDRMERHDLDVLTGLYRFKAKPCSPVLYSRNTQEDDAPLLPIAKYPEAIFQVQSAGAGCLLVKRKVFQAIEATGEGPFDRLPGLSEDHSFFRRLEKLNIPVWCDPRIECPHLAVKQVNEADDADYAVSELFPVHGFA